MQHRSLGDLLTSQRDETHVASGALLLKLLHSDAIRVAFAVRFAVPCSVEVIIGS